MKESNTVEQEGRAAESQKAEIGSQILPILWGKI